MGMKDERGTYCRNKKNKIYAFMDKEAGLKDPIKNEKVKKDKMQTVVPEQCKDCKYRINMCYIGRIRIMGNNFKCDSKIIEVQKREENI